MRQYFVKADIEGAECRAMRGMVGFLSRVDARSIVGFQMEWHLAGRECCSELVAPGGAFEILHTRHGLCPRAASKAQIIGEMIGPPIAALCSRRAGDHRIWDLIFSPCAEPQAGVSAVQRRVR